MSAYCGKLLRVNLTSGRLAVEAIDPKIAAKFVGGRGLGTFYLYAGSGPRD